MLLMLTSTFTGIIIGAFESALAANVTLTVFIPMLMDTGGNSGAQSSITVIRALSHGEIRFADAYKVLFKEFRVALLCSVCLAALMFVKIMTVDRWFIDSEINTMIALTVSLTLAATVCIAKLIGTMLPMIACFLKLDPAVMASPLITTLVDTVSLTIYFTLASIFLHL